MLVFSFWIFSEGKSTEHLSAIQSILTLKRFSEILDPIQIENFLEMLDLDPQRKEIIEKKRLKSNSRDAPPAGNLPIFMRNSSLQRGK
jgi:hypothetical protein